jgi:acyl-coenzyme A thioesterase PaaI-like protein
VADLATEYPPVQHVLRDLSLAIDATGEGRAAARTVLTPSLVRDGEPVPGVLTTVVDALGGHLAMFAVAPDWMATGELTLHRWGTPTGTIAYDGTVLRRGRTLLVVRVTVVGDGGPVAASTMTFAILQRRGDTPVVDLTALGALPAGTTLVPEGPPAAPPDAPSSLSAALGYLVTTEGAEVAVTPYVRNSFGALNGGVVAGLAETAAIGAAGGVARQLTVHYLRQATVGPVVARRRALGALGGLDGIEVEVVDRGAGDRRCALATVLVDRAPR